MYHIITRSSLHYGVKMSAFVIDKVVAKRLLLNMPVKECWESVNI